MFKHSGESMKWYREFCAALLPLLLSAFVCAQVTAVSKPIRVVNPGDKPFSICVIYDSKCTECTRFYNEVEKMKFNLKDYVEFRKLDVQIAGEKKEVEGLGIIQTEQSTASNNVPGLGFSVNLVTVSHPYPVLIAYGKEEILRLNSFTSESNMYSKLDAAGVRRPPPNPFKKIKLSTPPYKKGKGKVMIFSAPSGILDVRVYGGGKEIKRIANSDGMLFWDLKDSSGIFVEKGNYLIKINDLKENSKEFEISIE